MMKNICIAISISVSLFSLIGCSKFESINTNTEQTERVSSSMIATRVIVNLGNQPSQKSFMQPYMLSKYIAWSELVEGYQYNNLGRGSLSYTALNDLNYMVEFAASPGLKNSYQGLSYLTRAIRFYQTTMQLGDVPYSEAAMGESDKIYFPKYDSQKEVFIGILQELDLADEAFAAGDNFPGDPVYQGNVLLWRRFVNSFQLEVLMQLSKKEGDTDLNIRDKFARIYRDRPLFESNSHNFQLIRSDRAGQLYPFYRIGNNFTIYPMVTDEIIDRLKERSDRRLFYYANPSPVQLQAGLMASDFNAYKGVDPSASFQDITLIKSSDDFSPINNRYIHLPEGEPTQFLSYAQHNFTLAEAAARGWIAGLPSAWASKGIEASMQFIAQYTPNELSYHHNMPLTAAYIQDYITTYISSFPSHPESIIEEIITQKYLEGYLQMPYTTFYDYRRTGYPSWKINPSTSLNEYATDQIPMRWMYPLTEYNYNTDQVDLAVARQFGGQDLNNSLMWILQ